MEKFKRGAAFYTVIFLVGGCLYSTVEIIFRGHTHISMLFAGGVCLSLISFIDRKLRGISFLLKILLCGLVITAVELIFGLIFNVLLGLNVWNYSGEAFNLFGQVCLPFSLMWVLISIPALLLTRLLAEVFYGNYKSTL